MSNNKYIGTFYGCKLQATVNAKRKTLKVWLDNILIYHDVLIGDDSEPNVRTLEDLAKIIVVGVAKHGKVCFGEIMK